MKHTGSALVVLLVGLLTACTPSTLTVASIAQVQPVMHNTDLNSNVCIDKEDTLTRLQVYGPLWTHNPLDGKMLATFIYNYNREPPVTDDNITDVIISSNSSYRRGFVVSILIDGCLYSTRMYSPNEVQHILRVPESA